MLLSQNHLQNGGRYKCVGINFCYFVSVNTDINCLYNYRIKENLNALNSFIMSTFTEFNMHNLVSFNQLIGSQNDDPQNDLIAEYYECLIGCDEDQHICKRICKEVLIV